MHELTETERLKNIILPQLAIFFTQHKQDVSKWLEQKFSAFDLTKKTELQAMERRLIIPITDEPQLAIYAGTEVPGRAFGLNNEVFFRIEAGVAVEMLKKFDGQWTVIARFLSDWSDIVNIPLGVSNASRIAVASSNAFNHPTWLEATGAVNGVNTVYTMPTAYFAGSMKPYRNSGLQWDFAETNPTTGIVTMGFTTSASSQGNELTFDYEEAV